MSGPYLVRSFAFRLWHARHGREWNGREGTASEWVGPAQGWPQWIRHEGEEREQGSGTVAIIGVLLMLVALCVGGLHVSRVGVDRARAQTVVDLAALHGADVAATWEWENVGEAPCLAATEVLTRNDLTLEACTHEGGDVRVQASMNASPLGHVEVRARAGTR